MSSGNLTIRFFISNCSSFLLLTFCMSFYQDVYLDCHATTPLDSRVLETMMPYLTDRYANPSSIGHTPGRIAANALETARAHIRSFLNATENDTIVLTSGATESNNIAINGFAKRFQGQDNNGIIITTQAEHASITATCRHFANHGFQIVTIPVLPTGMIDLPLYLNTLYQHRSNVALACMQLANNETGTIYPVQAVGAVCRELGIPFHVDASQAGAWIDVNVTAIGCTTLALSGHKMFGPKGVGVLFIKHGTRLTNIMFGGNQEFGFRPGTQNLPAIVGMGRACELAVSERESDCTRIDALRNCLLNTLLDIQGGSLNGSMECRLPNNLNISFDRIRGAVPLSHLVGNAGVAVSSTSACGHCPGQNHHSILKHMQVPATRIFHALRIGLGRNTSMADIETAAQIITNTVDAYRQ